MPLTKYEEVKPKNLHEFSALYKKADRTLRKLKYQLEKAYDRPLDRKKTEIHF